MRRILLSLLLLTAACGESAAEKAQREAARREAEIYSNAAAQHMDRAARDEEDVHVLELRHAVEGVRVTRAQIEEARADLRDLEKKDGSFEPARQIVRDDIASAEKNLARWQKHLAERRPKVEADRDKLLALRKETKALLGNRKAGVSRDVLDQRLQGIEESLTKIDDALAFADQKPDGG